MKKLLSLMLALTMVITILTGCGEQMDDGTVDPDNSGENLAATDEGSGTLRLYAPEDLDTLNPHLYKSSDTRVFFQMVGGTLYRLHPSENGVGYVIIPEYAESDPVQMDEEGLVWQIKVRDDAKWSNGEALTADAFAYGLKMLFDPLLLNHRATVLEESNIYVKNADVYFSQQADGTSVDWEEVGVKVLDGNVLEITLDQPANVSFMKYCFATATTQAVYEPLYEAGMNAERTETDFGTSVDKYVSAGPLMVNSWEKGSEYTAVKNPYYPLKDEIYLAGVNFKVIPEKGTAMQMFETGELDYVALTSAALEQYGEDPRIMEVPAAASVSVGINCISEDNAILQNVKFRQALYFGVNRDEVAKLTNGIPASYFITPEYIADIESGLSFRETAEAQAILPENNGYDPDKAKQLMDEALAEAGQSKASIQIIYQDSSANRKAVSEYLQKAWPELFGTDKLEVKLQAVPSSQLSEQLRDHVNNPNSFELGWIASIYNQLDPSSALMEWSKDANRKKISYYDDEFTAVYNEIKALPLSDTQGRTEKTAEAESILLNDAPVIPLYQEVSRVMVSDRVTLAITEYNTILEYGWSWAKIAE